MGLVKHLLVSADMDDLNGNLWVENLSHHQLVRFHQLPQLDRSSASQLRQSACVNTGDTNNTGSIVCATGSAFNLN